MSYKNVAKIVWFISSRRVLYRFLVAGYPRLASGSWQLVSCHWSLAACLWVGQQQEASSKRPKI